jgi:dienelactone hydrolase
VGVAVEGLAPEERTFEGATKTVYRAGSGPAVIVIHEQPGLTPNVAGFGRRVADAGFTAVLPSLFGVDGRSLSLASWLPQLARNCVAKEFAALAAGRTAPVTTWLRALARAEHERCGGPGVGVVGMCFTGGFGLAMAVDDTVLAPVLAQPSLPLGPSRRKKADVHLSPDDLAAVKARDDLCVLGLRYEQDWMSPPERFGTLRRELGDRFISVELPGKGHSTLTEHVDEGAVETTLRFLRDRLLADGHDPGS